MAAEGKKPYYQAAQFYYDYNLDLNQAITWIDAAIKANPTAYPFYYHKATFLAKLGDKAGAEAVAKQSMEMARKGDEPERSEYLRLNQALLDSLK